MGVLIMYGDIFVKVNEEDNLEQFANRIFEIFNVKDFYRRESSFYVNEEYFIGSVMGIDVIIAFSDEVDISGYKYWINLSSKLYFDEKDRLIELFTDLIARLLVGRNYEVIVPDSVYENRKFYLYRKNPSSEMNNDVLVTLIDQA